MIFANYNVENHPTNTTNLPLATEPTAVATYEQFFILNKNSERFR